MDRERASSLAGPGVGERLAASRAAMVAAVAVVVLWPVVPLFLLADPSVLADPGEYLLHHFGFFASVFLALTLCLTPLRRVWPEVSWIRRLQRHRRFLGLSTFGVAVIHFGFYLLQAGGLAGLQREWNKPFIVVGLVSLFMLSALAVTSADRVVRGMGARRWKQLHRCVYAVGGLVVYHQISADKVFPLQVLWVFGPVLVLQIARVWKWRTSRTRHA